MRILEQKKRQPARPGFSKLARSSIASSGPNHPALDLQRTVGNQAVHRMLTHAEGLKAEKEKIDSNTLQRTATDLIQRKVGADKPNAQSSSKHEDKKAELMFHSRMAIESTQRKVTRSTFPLEEGYTGIEIRWVVRNEGWQTAPEHIDKVTIYNANLCSGCRNPKDEIASSEFQAPSIVSNKQLPGQDEYEGFALIVMSVPAGHYDVYVDLDVYDEVEEIIEENNTTFESFYVRPRKKSGPDTDDD